MEQYLEWRRRRIGIERPGRQQAPGTEKSSGPGRFSPSRFKEKCNLAGRLFPPHIRKEAWDPILQDEFAEYLQDRKTYKGKWARRWLAFCFWLRFALNFALTCRVWFLDSLEKLVPEKWRIWR